MATYRLTAEAEGDLQEIADYTFDTFGLLQAETYGRGLRSCFDTIADNPRIGRDFGHVKNGVRRYEYQSHSVYYTITAEGILVLRVLGNRMDPGRHL